MFRLFGCRPGKIQRASHAYSPRLEELEDRCLLSGGAYSQTNLVANTSGTATQTDAHLVDPWGLAIGNGSFLVANDGSNTATLYNSSGTPQTSGGQPIVIATPAQPTGAVFNSTGSGFNVTQGSTSASSEFLIATKQGVIAGWAPSVNATGAIFAVNNPSASYTGLALATGSSGTLLYAADYKEDKVDVYTSTFQLTDVGAFADPNIPAGYAPFNIQNIGGDLYVTFARQNYAAGAASGYVDVFDTTGQLLQRLTSGGNLNLPWGLAVAPSNFGQFANDLLVGNQGDGHINAYDPSTGTFLGQLHGSQDYTVAISGLWSLQFGTGGSGAATNALYFTGGGNGQQGLFGTLAVIPGVDTQTLSVVTSGSNSTIYAISANNTLYQHTNTGGWVVLGAGIQSVSAVMQKSGTAVVFVETLDHALFQYSSAKGWQEIGAPGTILSISAGLDTSGVATVWVITSGTALTEFKTASGWVGNNIGGAGTILQMSATDSNRVIVITTSNAVYEHDDVYGWFTLSSSGYVNLLSAITDNSGNLVLFAVGLDRSLVRYDTDSGWSVQSSSGTAEYVGAGLDASGAADVYIITSGGALAELNDAYGWRTIGGAGTIDEFTPTSGDRVIVVTTSGAVAQFDDASGWVTLTSPGFALG